MESTVRAQWLKTNIDSVIVIEVFADKNEIANSSYHPKEFKQGHIPGASALNLWSLGNGKAKYDFSVLPPEEVATVISKHGISNDSSVVIYERGNMVQQFGNLGLFACKLWWLLKYHGLDSVAILNGGYSSWESAGFEVEKTIKAKKCGTFVANIVESMNIPYETVKAISKGENQSYQLLDARPKDASDQFPIKGAKNLACSNVATKSGLKSDQDLEKLFKSVLSGDKQPVMFCNSGMQCALLAFAAHKAGFEPKLWQCGYNEHKYKTSQKQS